MKRAASMKAKSRPKPQAAEEAEVKVDPSPESKVRSKVVDASGAEAEALARIQAAVTEAQAAIAEEDAKAAQTEAEEADPDETQARTAESADAGSDDSTPRSKATENFEAICEPQDSSDVETPDEKAEDTKAEAALEDDEPATDEFADLPPVLIAAAEAAPLAKTGGLADVVGALPKYLKKIGVDARIIMPFHRIIKERYRYQTEHLFDYIAGPQWSDRFVGIDKLELDGTIYYFVDNEHYFGGEIYSGDNFEGEQYGFFVQAVCDAIPNLDFDPGIIHCNDWHTALIPFKLKAKAARLWSTPPRTLLTIHNLAFQGTYGNDLAARVIGQDERAYAWDLGVWNMMKAGIDTADFVNTVSPTYAWEITTPEFGEGLQNDLRYMRDNGRLAGILNGIDTDTWNPSTDEHLPAHYQLEGTPIEGETPEDFDFEKIQDQLKGKRECKRALLQELGLDDDADAPLIAMVGRLTPQKGIGLMSGVIEACVPEGAMFVILGSGYPDLEWQMRDAENRHRGRVCSYIGYNNDLAHRIYAAADFFMMPSAFEPCGISQMIAMRYGTLPIVHETGGLKDTVVPYNQFTGEGVGFSFSRFDVWDATEACKRALSVFPDKAIMSRLVQNAMFSDFGFDRCARSYAELYRQMVQG